MKTTLLGKSNLECSRLAYGCWRVAGTWNPAEVTPASREQGLQAITTAYEAGFTLFDNADIYCRGEAETILGAALARIGGMRDRVLVATKCGIRAPGDPSPDSPHRYDFSSAHIIASAESSLRRLGIECIDLMMLHRPDYLADPAEIAATFSTLRQAGKVRHFGVSNFRPSQFTALQRACPMPLVVNQVEISLANLDAFSDGTLDQCLAERVTPMAWSPLAAGLLGSGASRLLPSQQHYTPGKFLPALAALAQARGTTPVVAALAWLLRHPAGIQPIIGSTTPARIRESALAAELVLTREEWYRLFVAARGEALP